MVPVHSVIITNSDKKYKLGHVLQNVTESCHIVWQVLQNVTKNCYNMWQVLQNETRSYYKMWKLLQNKTKLWDNKSETLIELKS